MGKSKKSLRKVLSLVTAGALALAVGGYSILFATAATETDDAAPVAAAPVAAEKAAAGPTKALGTSEGTDHVVFGVISDTHVTAVNFTTQARLAEAFKFFSGTSTDPNAAKLDAVVVAGDLSDSGSSSDLNTWKAIKDVNLSPDVKLIAAMGNHEANQWANFEKATGDLANAVYDVNGYTFITVSPGEGTLNTYNMRATVFNTGAYRYIVKWLEEQLKAAEAKSPDKPIFVFFHHPIRDTFYVSHEWYGSGLEEVFQAHPRAVTFAGHIHSPNNNPLSIWQDGGFTAINTVTLKYFELETGMTYGSVPPNSGNAAQGLVLDVTDNQVTVYNYDFISKSWIDQTWTFTTADNLADADLPYTTAVRTAQAGKPEFAAGAKLTVNKAGLNSVRMDFDQAFIPANSVGDIVHSYVCDFINQATGKTDVTYKAFSEYYFLPMPKTIGADIDGLKSGTEYELQVHAVDAYGLVSDQYLSATFTLDVATLPGANLATTEFPGSPAEEPTEVATAVDEVSSIAVAITPDTGDSSRTVLLLVAFAGLAAFGVAVVVRQKSRRA
ncbi:MAG: metallophosphoesterase [Oscillospiraceae bacterium]|nr:metallophosphoesterase [Oscillospiraceae bacterium]